MSTFSMRFTIVALAVFAIPMAHAQSGGWYATGSIVYNDDDPDRLIDDGVSGLQFNVGRDLSDRITLEGLIAYSKIDGFYDFLQDPTIRSEETQLDLGAQVLAYYDRDASFAPYAVFGLGYQNANLALEGKEKNPTASIGAGFKWQLGESRASLRGEIAMRRIFDGGNREFNDSIARLGVQYRFGAQYKVAEPTKLDRDSDNDGVLDLWDKCPGTPPGVDVTASGCEIQDMSRDSDNDRVPDNVDECPNTPTGAPVDSKGCSLDSDMDGVLTGDDRCPASRPGADVDQFGCEADDDRDGVLNHKDNCPNTRSGARVDSRGCEIRDVISLPGVNFRSGSDLLLGGAENLIRDIAATLKANDYLQIEVAGHTDSQGDEMSNQGLSDRRAKTVYDFLLKYGVDASRLTFRGYGESMPIADNATAEGRATNRRVELRVVKR